jgi:TolB-like protein
MVIGLLSSCSVMQVGEHRQPLLSNESFGILPFRNLAQSPQASERVASLVAALMRTQGLLVLEAPQAVNYQSLSSQLLTDDDARYQDALRWANQQNLRYAVTGSVDEWRYKSGLDGEPAVGITLNIVDLQTQEVIWTSTGARSGWGREGVAMAARTLLSDLLDDLPLDND